MSEVSQIVTLPGQIVVDAVIGLLAADEYIVGLNEHQETELSEQMSSKGVALYRAAFGSIFAGPADDDPEAPLFAHCESAAETMARSAYSGDLAERESLEDALMRCVDKHRGEREQVAA